MAEDRRDDANGASRLGLTVRLAETRHGVLLYNPNDVYVGRSIERYGEFSQLESEFFVQLCKPGDTVFDVGANIGAHTVALAQHVGERGFVYAFEPQRVIFQMLCANVALNGLTNVESVAAVVGRTAGEERLPDVDYAAPANFGGLGSTSFGTGRRVRRVALDDYLDAPSVALIKVDVEGMESEVLAGAAELIARDRPLLYLENDRTERSAALIAQLFGLEYRLFWHLPPLFNPGNYRGDPENVFPGIVSVNMLGVPRERDAELIGFREVLDPNDRWNA
jgi:FkbM family methyltransferase